MIKISIFIIFAALIVITSIYSCRKDYQYPKYRVTVEAYLDSVKINANFAFLPEPQSLFKNSKETLTRYFYDNYNPSNGFNVSSRSADLQEGTYDIVIQVIEGTPKLVVGTYTFKSIVVNDSTKNSIYRMLFQSNLTGDRQPWKEFTPPD